MAITCKAHLPYEPAAEHLATLCDALSENVRLTLGEEFPTDTQILVAGRPVRDKLNALPNLEVLLIPFAGLPAITVELMRDYPQIAIHNLHYNAPMTAEMAIALMLTAAKVIIPADREFRKHDWTPRYEDNRTIVMDGKTVLILGYGAVGQRVAAVCRALGMHVIATKRHIDQDYPDDIYPAEALHDLLPRADVLMICLPATTDTTGLIGGAEIALLPEQAIVVNVGRAAVIEAMALYNALKDQRLHSAALDVWYRYPPDAEARKHTPPSDYPFGKLDRVVMSPHRAGGGGAPEVEDRRMKAIAESLNAVAQGESMPHRVDLSRGY